MIMSQKYKGACAEIKSVDAQESLNGGVIVVVTGTMSYAHQCGREFVQTFFLAPQVRPSPLGLLFAGISRLAYTTMGSFVVEFLRPGRWKSPL